MEAGSERTGGLNLRYSDNQLRLLGLMCPIKTDRQYRNSQWPYAFTQAWFFPNESAVGQPDQYSPSRVKAPILGADILTCVDWLWRRSLDRYSPDAGAPAPRFPSEKEKIANKASVMISGILWESLFPQEFGDSSIGLSVSAFFKSNLSHDARLSFLNDAFKNDSPIYAMIFDIRSRDCVRLADGELPSEYIVQRRPVRITAKQAVAPLGKLNCPPVDGVGGVSM